jgi:predicted transcriptional regulator YheO
MFPKQIKERPIALICCNVNGGVFFQHIKRIVEDYVDLDKLQHGNKQKCQSG